MRSNLIPNSLCGVGVRISNELVHNIKPNEQNPIQNHNDIYKITKYLSLQHNLAQQVVHLSECFFFSFFPARKLQTVIVTSLTVKQ